MASVETGINISSLSMVTPSLFNFACIFFTEVNSRVAICRLALLIFYMKRIYTVIALMKSIYMYFIDVHYLSGESIGEGGKVMVSDYLSTTSALLRLKCILMLGYLCVRTSRIVVNVFNRDAVH